MAAGFGRQLRESAFFLDKAKAFTNHGSFGTIPKPVFEAQQILLRTVEQNPDQWFRKDLKVHYMNAIAQLAEFLEASPADLVFVENATTAVSTVLRSQPWTHGDSVMLTTLTYGACSKAAQAIARDKGATVRTLEIKLPLPSTEALVRLFVEQLESHPDIRFVLLDHITSPTAIVVPVKEITDACHARNIRVMVDGAHAPGQLKINLAEIGADYYTGNLHKWMFCPRGCAFLYVSPEHQADTPPLVISHDHFKTYADKFFMQATRDYTTYCTVPAAFKFITDIGGLEAISSYNHNLSLWATDMLCKRWNTEPLPIAPELRSPFLSIVGVPKSLGPPTVERKNQLMEELLEKHNVIGVIDIVDGQLWCRISTQVYNTQEDYVHLAEAVEQLAQTGTSKHNTH